MSEESHTPSDILVFAENRFLRLFCLWSARLHRDANERERAKIRTINLPLNRCRWAFLLIIMIINFAQAVDGIPSPPRPTHRAQKNIKRKTKTRKISLNGSSSSSNRAHTFARNEFILQHSRCLFIRLNNISPTSSFAFMRRRAPTTTTTSTTVFPPRRRRRREQKFIFFFTYLCSNPRLNHLRM